MKNKLREIWAEYGLAVKIIAVGAAFMIALTGVALYKHEVDAARKLAEKQKIEKAERRAAAKRKKQERAKQARERERQAAEQAELERLREQRVIHKGDQVQVTDFIGGFANLSDAKEFSRMLIKRDSMKAEAFYDLRFKQGAAAPLSEGLILFVSDMSGAYIQVRVGDGTALWWVHRDLIRKADN